MTPTQKPDAAVLPELPETAGFALVQGFGGTEDRLLSTTYDPDSAAYSANQMQAYALAAIAASQAVVAVPGWQLVPVMMTDAMRDAGNEYTQSRSVLHCAWRAMLAAAPQPAAQHPEKVDLAACEGGGVTQWQPIETAPKDRTTVLLSVRTTFGKWNRTLPLAGRWFDGSWGIFNADESVQKILPTHWMPLPSPPARGNESPTSQINLDSPSANKGAAS